MIRFDALERVGPAVAAISDMSDDNCALFDDGAAASRDRFCSRCGVVARDLVYGRQTHSVNIAVVGDQDRGRIFSSKDGLITACPGLPLGVSVADCVPLYLFDAKARVGGLIHAGREGTFKNIASRAIEALTREFSSRAEDVYAFIGPSAGPCCYEVSPEIAAAFHALSLPVQARHLDLWQANMSQLMAVGVPVSHIVSSGICTICDGRFFSYRQTATAARNLAILTL